jgi:hypothetical protein
VTITNEIRLTGLFSSMEMREIRPIVIGTEDHAN